MKTRYIVQLSELLSKSWLLSNGYIQWIFCPCSKAETSCSLVADPKILFKSLKSQKQLRVWAFRLSLCLHTVYCRRMSLTKLRHDQWGDQLVVNCWSKSEETLDWLWEDSFKASCEWAATVCGVLWEPLNCRKSHLVQFALQGPIW